MKRYSVLLGATLVVLGASLLLNPLRVSDAAGHTRQCGPSLVRVLVSGTHDGLCDTATAFVVFGALVGTAGLATILFALFGARPLARLWERAVEQG